MTVPRIFAIDPGPVESAWLELAEQWPVAFATEPNAIVLDRIGDTLAHVLAIETIVSYGMSVGAETFDTCVWAGRFVQAFLDGRELPAGSDRVMLVPRPDVKLHLCHSRRAKDPNVRQALIDRYGPGKSAAIGLKKTPGPLYGVSGHAWSALAVAVTAADQLAVPEQLVIVGGKA